MGNQSEGRKKMDYGLKKGDWLEILNGWSDMIADEMAEEEREYDESNEVEQDAQRRIQL